MLLWAMTPIPPYRYYTLLRFVCCGVFALLAYEAVDQGKKKWGWILGITALIYNPIFRVHLYRELWSIINVITIGTAIVSIYVLKMNIMVDKVESLDSKNFGDLPHMLARGFQRLGLTPRPVVVNGLVWFGGAYAVYCVVLYG